MEHLERKRHNPGGHAWWGNYGAQIHVDKLNALGAAIEAYDEVIELLVDVLNNTPRGV